MKSWIQEPDYASKDLGELSPAEAVRAFEGYDWEERLARRRFLASAAEKHCEPCIGFVAADGRILNVCPAADGRALVHYHYAEEIRWLWLLRRFRPALRTREGLRRGEVPEIIRRFFASDHDWLLAKLS